MRSLLNVTIPHQPFNATVKDGTAGPKLNRILEAIKPEASIASIAALARLAAQA
jgi:hypothetical protein